MKSTIEQSSVIIEENQKTEVKSGIKRDYFFMVFFNAIVALLSFGTTTILLAHLGRENYGEIVSLTNVTILLSTLSSEWTAQAAIRFGTEEFLNRGQIQRIFWNRLAVCFCGVAIILFASPFWGRILTTGFQFTEANLVFISFYLPAQVAWMNLQRVLPPLGRHKLLYPLLAIERLVVISTAIIFYQFNWLKIDTILPAYIAGSLFSMSFAIWLVRREVGRPIRPDAATCRQIIRYSWPLIPTIMIGLLSTNTVDYLMIRRYMGNAELGVYALAIQIAGIVQQLPQIAGLLAAPRVIKMRLNNNIDGINHLIRNQLLPCLWFWSFALIIGATIVSLLGANFLPEKYMVIRELAWPLAAVTAIVPVWYIIWSPLLTAYEEVRVVMWSSVATGMTNILANLSLIPLLGVVGSAWATALAFMVSNLNAEMMIRFKTDSNLFPKRGLKLYLPSIMALIASLAGWILSRGGFA
jgi:O-antigen/teichoic acid export membrane protein